MAKVNEETCNPNNLHTKWVAYLERQKINTEGDFARGYDCGYECCLNSLGAEYLEKQKVIKLLSWRDVDECKDIPDGHYVVVAYNSPGIFELDTVFNGKLSHPNRGNLKATGVFYIPNANEKCSYLEKQKDQKPTEKQDYSGLTDFERAIHRGFLCAGVENVPVEIIKETAQECIDSMPKDGIAHRLLMKGEITPSEYIRLAYPNKKELQKPAEWSEEDEKIIQSLILEVDKYVCFAGIEANKIVSFLKSLRPQPHWKPTEEQMKALVSILPVMKGTGDKVQDILESLYNDLIKL